MKGKKGIKNKGITLIALVVTILVLLILAGISIGMLTGDNSIFLRAKEAKFKTRMAEIAEDWELNKISIQMNGSGKEETTGIHGGEVLKEIIQEEEEMEITDDEIRDIKELIPKINKKEEEYVIIYEGDFYYVSQDKIENNRRQEKWCEEIGIKIWDFKVSSGIKVVNGNYEYVNGIYVCTPKINTGFVKEKTRYIKESDGKLVPGNWINKKPDDDWYDYKSQKWANLYVESEGRESYYVWIPRYVYKTLSNERTDVKFVDINNNYKDGETDKETPWVELQAQGYKVPEAFYYGDSENYQENTPIPGYWVSKYQLSELSEYIVDYKTSVTPSTITIKEIETKTEKAIAKYTFAVNGKIVHESNTKYDKNI